MNESEYSNEADSHDTPGCKVLTADCDEDIGEYYFESDHLALKGNNDYRAILKCVTLLEAQRMKAILDLDQLIEAKEKALANPITFVEKLQRNEDLGLPQPQQVTSLPTIDWGKYVRSTSFTSFSHNHMTRHKKPQAASSDQQTGDYVNFGSSTSNDRVESDDSSSTPMLVRGRLFNVGKSQTFNQLWTVEEQKRLEDLLLQYPPEDVEARRWEKIAKALGNRTPQQVASRVQKYFIKLTKAGLPVPGRVPSLNNYNKKINSHRHQRHNRFSFQHSTFFASHEPPVFMSEYDDDTTNQSTASSLDGDHFFTLECGRQDEDHISPELYHTEEYQELLYLKRLRKMKERNQWRSGTRKAFRCCSCGCEPILGRRWHCIDCPPSTNFNLCDICSNRNFQTAEHLCGHRLEPIEDIVHTFIDDDYTPFVHGDYNYLDPNYMPAT